MSRLRFLIVIPEEERREKLREITERLREGKLSRQERARLLRLKPLLHRIHPVTKGILVLDEKRLALVEQQLKELGIGYQVKRLES